MGFIRGGLLVIASVLFFVSLVVASFFLTFSYSLDYEIVKPEIISVVAELVEDEGVLNYIDNNLEDMQIYCVNNSEFVFSHESETYSIACETINQGSQAILEKGIENRTSEIYYKNYECDFWDCLKEEGKPFFLISEKARNYWYAKFYYMIGILIIIIVAMFFLAEKKSNFFILSGSLIIASSFIFSRLGWIFSFFSEKSFLEYFELFFRQTNHVFWMELVLGGILLTTGIILKLFAIGFKINSFFNRNQNLESSEPQKVSNPKGSNKKSK